ncbi:uncharacterized protein LOC141894991 [Acropora palmata]
MGGSKSIACDLLAHKIWSWCIARSIWLSTVHIPGCTNVEADLLSRNCYSDHEWQLNQVVFQKLRAVFPALSIDLFASVLNAQLPRYVSWNPDPHATFIDAFSIPWTGEYFYAFPPFSLIHKCLKKIEAEQAEGVLVVPAWTSSSVSPQSSLHEGEVKIDGMSFIRRHDEERGFSEHVAKVLLDSWRPSTQKQYAVYLKKWTVFCRERQITAYSPTLMDVLEFLHTQLHLSYSALNTARSALSCVISIDNVPVGQHPLVCHFVKGAFERKPPSRKYYAIWDVRQVLNFLKTMSPNSSLSLMELSLKLSMLLALVSIQRKQTLLQLNINNEYLKKSDEEFVFILSRHVKQSRPNYSIPPLIIPRYTLDTDICPYVCLEDYIERTKSLRHDDVLLISTIKPHRAIGSQTLARWIKTVLQLAGVDIDMFKPHSTRHAASTAAYQASVPLDEIFQRAGWSNANTFKRFYYKHVIA